MRTVNWFISTRRVCMEDCEMFPATTGNRTLFRRFQIVGFGRYVRTIFLWRKNL